MECKDVDLEVEGRIVVFRGWGRVGRKGRGLPVVQSYRWTEGLSTDILLHTRETTVNKNIYFKEARKGPVFQGNC
jgi:hypothetical protein